MDLPALTRIQVQLVHIGRLSSDHSEHSESRWRHFRYSEAGNLHRCNTQPLLLYMYMGQSTSPTYVIMWHCGWKASPLQYSAAAFPVHILLTFFQFTSEYSTHSFVDLACVGYLTYVYTRIWTEIAHLQCASVGMRKQFVVIANLFHTHIVNLRMLQSRTTMDQIIFFLLSLRQKNSKITSTQQKLTFVGWKPLTGRRQYDWCYYR